MWCETRVSNLHNVTLQPMSPVVWYTQLAGQVVETLAYWVGSHLFHHTVNEGS